jgi:hypothetical protein
MRALVFLVVVCGLSAPAVAQRKPIDMGTFVIVAEPRRGVTLDPRAPGEAPPAAGVQKPEDLVRRSFRRALLGTASRL